jgi:hypothetical protein
MLLLKMKPWRLAQEARILRTQSIDRFWGEDYDELTITSDQKARPWKALCFYADGQAFSFPEGC